MQSRVYRLILGCWMVVALLPLDSRAQQDPEVVSLVGRHFEVVGTDQRSVSCANGLGTHVVDLCSRSLQAGSHAFPQRIFVRLLPDDRVEFEGDYQVRLGARGTVTLDFNWDESLSLETACDQLMHGSAAAGGASW